MTPRALSAAVVLLAVVVLSGCTASHAATAPTEAAPSAQALPAEPPFDGDCARVLTRAQLDTLVGETGAAQASLSDDTRGLICTWTGSLRALTVTTLPVAEADAEDVTRYTLPECDPATGFCGGGIEAAGLWIVVDFGFIEGEWEPIVSTALNAVAKAAEAHG